MQLTHWYHLHELTQHLSLDLIIIDIKFRNLSRLYGLDKLLASDVVDLIVLQLKLLDCGASVD